MDNVTDNSKKVLCIEDEHFISELYVRALNKAGFQTKVILDGVTGVAEAETNAYDIILLDLMLPQITGIEALRRLRGPKSKKLKSKIIITTNLDVDEPIKRELEQMADGYIIKAEITPKELVAFLQQIA